MRTPEQIKNCRQALLFVLGPYALIMPDEEIDRFMDNLQNRINEGHYNTKHTWQIKIKLNSNAQYDWETIKPEPKTPHASLSAMSDKCYNLLMQHPEICKIRISTTDYPRETHIFVRPQNKETK